MKRWKLSLTIVVILAAVWCLHSGTIRKKDDPIRKTQTDPIKYEEKMSEIKEGIKGAPSPSLRFYLDKKIQLDPPYEVTETGEDDWEEIFPELEEDELYLYEDEGYEDESRLDAEEVMSEEDLDSWWWDENTVKENEQLDVDQN